MGISLLVFGIPQVLNESRRHSQSCLQCSIRILQANTTISDKCLLCELDADLHVLCDNEECNLNKEIGGKRQARNVDRSIADQHLNLPSFRWQVQYEDNITENRLPTNLSPHKSHIEDSK